MVPEQILQPEEEPTLETKFFLKDSGLWGEPPPEQEKRVRGKRWWKGTAAS